MRAGHAAVILIVHVKAIKGKVIAANDVLA